MGKLLIDEYPLILLPTLAQAIGLNEAIFLQQVHYWCKLFEKQKDKRHYHRGLWWVYNTDDGWVNDNFPFWSAATVKRARTSCYRQGVLFVDRFNQKAYDRTNWYAIDQAGLDLRYDEWATGQNDQMDQVTMTPSSGSSRPDRDGQDDPLEQDELTPPIPETTRDHQGLDQIWANALRELEMQMTQDKFNRHYRGSRLLSCNGTATVACRDAKWVAAYHTTIVQRTLAGVVGESVGVTFEEG